MDFNFKVVPDHVIVKSTTPYTHQSRIWNWINLQWLVATLYPAWPERRGVFDNGYAEHKAVLLLALTLNG